MPHLFLSKVNEKIKNATSFEQQQQKDETVHEINRIVKGW